MIVYNNSSIINISIFFSRNYYSFSLHQILIILISILILLLNFLFPSGQIQTLVEYQQFLQIIVFYQFSFFLSLQALLIETAQREINFGMLTQILLSSFLNKNSLILKTIYQIFVQSILVIQVAVHQSIQPL
ncbi:unnamed protein product (macronuclear) [Paramecium tetraurelia]|uniref:Transmembrane protein n=1 Tax=Paramecium tetraurelia TaxID=5888 RepID=A0D789_PARTE|nr:uncharacterized protein GSPATT00001948001 [Paramecium tetraurelia]CAK78906.1 unnamed protein product [Paramecium tetraurelia]|eukprot:XP_001446303.1 hypothetical protein (macronuclear) [Paramecium tetraurelia strain d4-2]